MSQSDLAKRLKVTPQAVSWWESGGDPLLSTLRSIARVTKTPLAALVGA